MLKLETAIQRILTRVFVFIASRGSKSTAQLKLKSQIQTCLDCDEPYELICTHISDSTA